MRWSSTPPAVAKPCLCVAALLLVQVGDHVSGLMAFVKANDTAGGAFRSMAYQERRRFPLMLYTRVLDELQCARIAPYCTHGRRVPWAARSLGGAFPGRRGSLSVLFL